MNRSAKKTRVFGPFRNMLACSSCRSHAGFIVSEEKGTFSISCLRCNHIEDVSGSLRASLDEWVVTNREYCTTGGRSIKLNERDCQGKYPIRIQDDEKNEWQAIRFSTSKEILAWLEQPTLIYVHSCGNCLYYRKYLISKSGSCTCPKMITVPAMLACIARPQRKVKSDQCEKWASDRLGDCLEKDRLELLRLVLQDDRKNLPVVCA